MTAEDLRAFVGVAASLAVPAAAVSRHVARGLDGADRWLVGAAVSPFALGAPVLAIHFFGVPLGASFWLAMFVAAVLVVWPEAPPAGRAAAPPAAHPKRAKAAAAAKEPARTDAPPATGAFPARPALLLALGAVALVALPGLAIPYVRMWSDAWFHAGAAIEIAVRGLPPQDPNFAGIPLYYPWFFHGLVAVLSEASRVSFFHPQALLNAWAGGVLAFASARVGWRLSAGLARGDDGAGRGAGAARGAVALLAAVVALFGLNPLGGPMWVLRAVVGETNDLGAAWASLAGTNGAMQSLAWGFHPVNSSMLNRLWTGTALTPAIALAAAALAVALAALERPVRAAWAPVLLVAATMLAFHPAFGAIAIAAIVAGLALAVLWPGVRAGEEAPRPRAFVATIVLVAAVGLAMPYVRACSPPDASTPVRIAAYVPNVWAMGLGVGPWWLAILAALPLAWAAGPAGRVVLGAAAAGVGAALLVLLPEKNSQKLAFLAWVLIAPLAAAGLVAMAARLRRPRAAWIAALLLCVPTSLLYTIGVVREHRSPGVLIRGYEANVADLPLETPLERAGYDALDEYPTVTAVIESPRASVNEPIPVLAKRRVFCGALDVYLGNHFGGAAWGRRTAPAHVAGPVGGSEADTLPAAVAAIREEFLVRRGIVDALFAHRTLNAAQRLYLDSFRVPLVLIVRRRDVDDITWDRFSGDSDWDRTFGNDEVQLFRWRSADERRR